jgi:hypothetical protein
VEWIAAALVAAAIVVSGFALLGGLRFETTAQVIVLVAAVAVAGHLALHPDGWQLRLWCLIPTALLTWAAAAGVFFLVLATGGCDTNGDIGRLSWIGGVAIYFAGSTWALQRPVRGVVGVPASMVAGGVWLVATASLISGGTGACLD